MKAAIVCRNRIDECIVKNEMGQKRKKKKKNSNKMVAKVVEAKCRREQDERAN